MGHVIVGMDPHKRSATIEVIDAREMVLAQGRFGTGQDGYKMMLAVGRRFPDRTWAAGGCGGIGRHLAQRLIADGEIVVDVRSCRLGHGYLPRARVARATRWTRTRWLSPRCVLTGFRWLPPTARLSRCGCWPAAVTGWATRARTPSAGCTGCCRDYCPAGRRNSCPPSRRAPCSQPCGRAALPGAHGAS